MIRYIDQATCTRWDEQLELIDPSEGGAYNPFRPGWYWFDTDETPRGPFATRRLALEDQDAELNHGYQPHPDDQVTPYDTTSLDDVNHPFSPANVKRELGE